MAQQRPCNTPSTTMQNGCQQHTDSRFFILNHTPKHYISQNHCISSHSRLHNTLQINWAAWRPRLADAQL